jgi:hypothetical protein
MNLTTQHAETNSNQPSLNKTHMKFKTLLLTMMFIAVGSLLSAQGLKVEPGTSIKVETGTTLNISGGGNLLLESDATGDASVINLGSVTHSGGGQAIVKRYMPGEVSAWHMISAPVNGMGIAGSVWAPDTNEDLYLWNEPDPGIWVNYKNTTTEPTFATVNPGDNFVTSRGYIVNYNTANPTHNFQSSALNSGNVNITLAKSTAKSWDWNAGLNLIGNPYPSGLDWSLVTKTNIVTEVWAQVYDANKAGGAGYEPVNGPIASGQGFFVQAVTDQVVLALQPAHQVHTAGQTFMKNGADQLVLRLSSDTFFDETTILLNETSVPEHDFFDATKYFSFDPLVPQLYSQSTDGRKLAINSMDAVSESTVIPLSIKVQGSSIMAVQLTETGATFEGQEIVLHDVLTNTLHKLSEEPTYSFLANSDDNPDRFLLKFGTVGIAEAPPRNVLTSYMQHNLLYILNPDATKATVELFNIHGQVILRREIGQGLQSIPVDVATGTYLVRMRTAQAMAMRKLFIQQ